MPHETVFIFDFGTQYAQLIARRVRDLGVFSRIVPWTTTGDEIRRQAPRGVILSGGPASVYENGAPQIDPAVLHVGVPVLGICYGAQLMSHILGGQVARSERREYGRQQIEVNGDGGRLFKGLGAKLDVWMSHGDRIEALPSDFRVLAKTGSAPVAAFASSDERLLGVQFHPEVTHTPDGKEILRRFLFDVCDVSGDWKMGDFVRETVETIRAQVGSAEVICGLSGGVDSSVTAAIVHRAIGERLTCIFVDNGLLRQHEFVNVQKTFRDNFHMKLIGVDAKERFYKALAGVTDPEQKRKIIGREFIAVFEEEARRLPKAKFLAQGTLYPDVIESVAAHGGPTATIKSHHNVGGLPEKMGLDLVEPLRMLFKDEVRNLGAELGLPDKILRRHPFPGPGLGVRIVGEVNAERVHILQQADSIVLEEIHAAGLYRSIWQAFAVLLPVKTVGVMGDSRTYENAVVIRAVETDNGMTADWVRLPYDLLGRLSNRIINEVKGVNRVAYDISSKPPATIEWE